MGREVELKRIEKTASRQVTFSKREGMVCLRKPLSSPFSAMLMKLLSSSSPPPANLISSPVTTWTGQSPSTVMKSGLPRSNTIHDFRTPEFWRTELNELRRTAEDLEAKLRHLSGEDLSSLGMKELKQLERQLRSGVEMCPL